jgi:putative flippase GtrA
VAWEEIVMACNEDNVVIIPTLNPTNKLLKIVSELQAIGFNKIIVVDDGSNPNEVFDELVNLNVNVLHHSTNLGKGAAIKSALKAALTLYNNIDAYIFMDSDGQHQTNDVLKISQTVQETQEITLGVRNFNNKNVPFKSKFGNTFSSFYFKLTTGISLKDTQTGLRGIPIKYYDLLLNTPGDRYEYEMNFLTNIAKKHIPFTCITIKTIYENNNHATHFRPIKDAYLIYKEPIKFSISAITSFIIDLCLFKLFNQLTGLIFMANILARILSGIYNYNMNKYWCFKSMDEYAYIKYLILFIMQMLLSSSLIKILAILSNNLVILKMFIDFILFIISYIIQKRYVFNGDANE